MDFNIPLTNEMPKHVERFASLPYLWLERWVIGEVHTHDLLVLCFLLYKTNPYGGYAVVTTDEVAQKIGVSPDYAGKILRNLRKQKYVLFDGHQGVRGGFKVAMHGYNLTDERGWVNLTKQDSPMSVRSKTAPPSTSQSVPSPKVVQESPKSNGGEIKSIKDILPPDFLRRPKSIDDSDSVSH